MFSFSSISFILAFAQLRLLAPTVAWHVYSEWEGGLRETDRVTGWPSVTHQDKLPIHMQPKVVQGSQLVNRHRTWQGWRKIWMWKWFYLASFCDVRAYVRLTTSNYNKRSAAVPFPPFLIFVKYTQCTGTGRRRATRSRRRRLSTREIIIMTGNSEKTPSSWTIPHFFFLPHVGSIYLPTEFHGRFNGVISNTLITIIFFRVNFFFFLASTS